MTTDKSELPASTAFAMQFDSQALLLRSIMPAVVVAVDLVKNTVDVQPCLMGKRKNEANPYKLPIINDVPIQYYGAGDFWVTFEPKAGDYCVLSISDRSIEQWKKAGGIIDPVLNRHHDMTDAFAYFGINPFPDAIPAVEADTMHIRTKDGTTGVKVKSSEISYHVDSVPVATMTSTLVQFNVPVQLNQTLNVIGTTTLNTVTDGGTNIGKTHTHSGVMTGSGNTGTPN